MYLYHYNYKKPEYVLKELKQVTSPVKNYRLTYYSPYCTGIEVNDKVCVRLFLNEKVELKKTTGHNILILIHGFSSKKKSTDNYYNFAGKIISTDLSCAFINMPFHLSRTPDGEKSGQRMIYYDDVDTLKFFHQCVVDIKRLIDVLQEILPPKNIYICGSSLGSMVALVTMANEPRINKGVFLLGGGNWEEIHWNGILKLILKGDCTHKGKNVREECRRSYSNFPKFLSELKKLKNKKINMDLKSLPGLKKTASKMCFLCDPLAFAHKISPDKVLMINSKFDFYFPKKSTQQLWKELGRPKIHWLNTLHSSKILNNENIIAKIKQFLG
jgi:hypothetical protein